MEYKKVEKKELSLTKEGNMFSMAAEQSRAEQSRAEQSRAEQKP